MRKTEEVEIPHDAKFGRDGGKTFIITEMDAETAETWAIRALGAAAKSGLDIPHTIIHMGWSAIAFAGMRAVMSSDMDTVIPLLQQMMQCVKIKVEKAPEGRNLTSDDIEEIATRMFLRDEVFKLHANFSIREKLSDVIRTMETLHKGSISDTQTSPDPLQQP